MDTMIQLYMEDTEDMLQKADECLIRLETEYASDDINELFRIAHTIKGSSQMVGYEDIGSVMHKMEDMLDCVRNDTILFDHSIVSLCFKGLDIVKKMLQYKKEHDSGEMAEELIDEALRISETVEGLIKPRRKKEQKHAAEQASMGIVSTLLNKKSKGKKKYYISFFIEEDAPMISPVLAMILKSVDDIGSLMYSSVTDSYFNDFSGDQEEKSLDIILCTDMEEAELYTYFALTYLDRINIVNISRETLVDNDYFFNAGADMSYISILAVLIKLHHLLFNEADEINLSNGNLKEIEALCKETANAYDRTKDKDKISNFIKDLNELFSLITKMYKKQKGSKEELCTQIRTQLLKLTERAYYFTKGKHLFRVFKPEKKDFINIFTNFIERINRSATLMVMVDLSQLDMLYENEVKTFIEIKKQMATHGIELSIIADGPEARRMINIFDSIKTVEEFRLFRSELDALVGMFHSQDFYNRIVKSLGAGKMIQQ